MAKADQTATHMKQEDFASVFGFSQTQIRHSEEGRSRPLCGGLAYLMLIAFAWEQVWGCWARCGKGTRKVA